MRDMLMGYDQDGDDNNSEVETPLSDSTIRRREEEEREVERGEVRNERKKGRKKEVCCTLYSRGIKQEDLHHKKDQGLSVIFALGFILCSAWVRISSTNT